MLPSPGLSPSGRRTPHGSGVAPERLGRYLVGEKIADGGMASVYVGSCESAHDGPDGGPSEAVAIKVIRAEFAADEDFLAMFRDEARIAAHLRHPNIVRFLELGSDKGRSYITLELLLGQSLWAVWEACRAGCRRLPYGTIAWIGARIAEGLHHAHEVADECGRSLDIVHRDVNATNVVVTYDGEVKLIDFGLATARDRASKTASGIIKGKVAYMSPEQAVGAPVDRRTDVFALGATLWELGCDRRLFRDADDVETLRRVHAADVPDATRVVAGFPPTLWRILQRALARDRDGRYGSAAEFGRELEAFAAGVGEAAGKHALAGIMRDLFARERAMQSAWVRPPRVARRAFAVRWPSPPTGATRPLWAVVVSVGVAAVAAVTLGLLFAAR